MCAPRVSIVYARCAYAIRARVHVRGCRQFDEPCTRNVLPLERGALSLRVPPSLRFTPPRCAASSEIAQCIRNGCGPRRCAIRRSRRRSATNTVALQRTTGARFRIGPAHVPLPPCPDWARRPIGATTLPAWMSVDAAQSCQPGGVGMSLHHAAAKVERRHHVQRLKAANGARRRHPLRKRTPSRRIIRSYVEASPRHPDDPDRMQTQIASSLPSRAERYAPNGSLPDSPAVGATQTLLASPATLGPDLRRHRPRGATQHRRAAPRGCGEPAGQSGGPSSTPRRGPLSRGTSGPTRRKSLPCSFDRKCGRFQNGFPPDDLARCCQSLTAEASAELADPEESLSPAQLCL